MSIPEYELEERAKAPRVTQEDVLSSITSIYYFTALEGVIGKTFMRGEGAGDQPKELGLLTFCVLILKNGFTVTGQSACASPENYQQDIGEAIAHENAVKQIWPLLGYELRSQLHQKEQSA